MVNPYAGEVALILDGQRHVAKLTLGALAELEAALNAGSLVELVERFEGHRFFDARCAGVDRRGPAWWRVARHVG